MTASIGKITVDIAPVIDVQNIREQIAIALEQIAADIRTTSD